MVLFFFGVFDASVAQASSEGWFGRFLDRSLCFCFVRRGARARVHVIAAWPLALARARSSYLTSCINLLHEPYAAAETYLGCQASKRQQLSPGGTLYGAQSCRI